MLVCGCRPNAASISSTALRLTRPRKRTSIASAGFPGMSRGRMKFSVSAANSVMAKNSRRLSAYLMGPSLDGGAPSPARRGGGPGWSGPKDSLRRLVQVREHDLDVGQVPRRRRRVRILLGGPAGEVLGAVLVPGHALGGRYHRHVLVQERMTLLDTVMIIGRD